MQKSKSRVLMACAPLSANLGWLLGTFVVIASVAVSSVGCARTAAVHGPLTLSDHRSAVAIRGNKHARRREQLGATRIVTASWYGPGYEGRRTASGEAFNPDRLTAASKKLPLDSIVRVTNLRNGRSVDVKVNDRGPATSKRGIDLSPAAARRIGLTKSGVARVKIATIISPRN